MSDASNFVIPAPTARAAAIQAGVLATEGSWDVRADAAELEPVAAVVRALLEPHGGAVRPGGGSADRRVTLRFGDVPSPLPAWGIPLGGSEAHRVVVGPEGITCQGETAEGVFRAAATAVQMIATAPEIPYQELDDAPRHSWRGLMLDPARAFIPVEGLRRLIDLAALYKLNVLHLHLSDNQGWRLEIPDVPELTRGADPFYTVDDYREIQAYAAARFVTVIPEIDLPGHCGALREALPHLPAAPVAEGDAAKLELLRSVLQFSAPLDFSDPATDDTVARILAYVCAATTGPFVHVGADEAAGMTHESYVAAVRRLRDIVRASGKRPVAWQESSRAGSGPDDVTQHWFDPTTLNRDDSTTVSGIPEEALEALAALFAPTADDLGRILDGGGRVVLSNQSHLYLDRRYGPDTAPPRQADAVARLGLYPPRSLEDMAAWDPADYGVPQDRIAGIEAPLWGESITGFDDVAFLLLPRIASIAGTAWSGRPAAWQDHRERLARHGRLWSARGLMYFASTEIPWTGN
ncbi:beta-N-acetylhexosaminidase [Yinghuangia sp. ASG 101]|uniref:family 20 glycosylhydrolase n=1 Tax=Yinghuangia sp. ASG 101 TaxID=2896848 RepID=UPI001E39FC08|nr:family 20 glycosylhydrolase [Yinghuangia sp. ASG 101]UGQ11022.1 beta-N-acetylhexosaminidase [Yinghuangia sp. ASG 101]